MLRPGKKSEKTQLHQVGANICTQVGTNHCAVPGGEEPGVRKHQRLNIGQNAMLHIKTAPASLSSV